MTEYFGTGSKKVRGRAQRSTDLIEAMYEIAEASQPITGRGVGYKLFTEGKIPSMSRPNMQRVYRLLKEAREEGIIPWHWIVDETRGLETWATWKNPAAFVEQMAGSYRRDFWDQQPVRVQVWSEKGTVRGVLNKVLRKYAVDFQVMHGFSGATTVYGLAQGGDDGRPLVALYVGDYDPSGLFMSECDLPERLERYGGHHVRLNRIAIVGSQRGGLQSFPAASKRKDPRYKVVHSTLWRLVLGARRNGSECAAGLRRGGGKGGDRVGGVESLRGGERRRARVVARGARELERRAMTTELAKYNEACRLIAEAKAVDEVKDIRDRAVAMAAYARQAKNRDMEADAAEIRMRATCRLGEMVREQKRTIGLNPGTSRLRREF